MVKLFHIINDLIKAVANKQFADPSMRAQIVMVWHRLHFMRNRLQNLVNRWRAGTLPKPRKSRAGKARKPNTNRQPPTPTRFGWLVHHVGYTAGGPSAWMLDLINTDPEFEAFVMAAPQAGRILRPLLRLLCIELPAYLKLPPRLRKPRKPRPRKPREPRVEPHRSSSPLHLRLEVPGIPNRPYRRRKTTP